MGLFRTGSVKQIPCVVWQSAVEFTGQQRQFSPLRNTSWLWQQSSSVESGEQTRSTAVALPRRDSQASTWAWLSRWDQGQQKLGKVLSCASLNEAKIVEDERPRSIYLCKQATVSLHHCLSSPIYIPSNISCPPRVLPQHMRLSQLTSLCQPTRVWGNCKICSTPLDFFFFFLVHFSLWSPDKWSSTMQYKVDQHMCVFSNKSFITFITILSHACFSRTSFHLCLFQWNIFFHVFAPTKQHPTQ